jgi:recombination protein RecA
MTKISDIQVDLKKSHGEQFVTSAEQVGDIERLPTGIYPFDYATGGGFPRGRTSIIWGAESSGKTNLALKAIAMNQRLEPDKVNVFIDLEHSFDPKWATLIGVDCDKKKLAVIQPNYAEQAINIIQGIVAADDAGCIVLDSIGAMITINEDESDAAKQQVGGAALVITKMVKKLIVGMSKATSFGRYPTVLIINQMRNKIGVMFGSPDDMPGGKALKHHSALTVKVRGSDIIEPSINKDRASFRQIKGTVFKTKVRTLHKEFTFDFPLTNQGGLKVGFIDDWNTISSQLKDLGWLYKEGKIVTCFDQQYPTYKAVREDLYKNPKLLDAVREKIMEAKMSELYDLEEEDY